MSAEEPAPRFEEQVVIDLKCCGQSMTLGGNLSLRGPAPRTVLGFECKKCYRRVAVVDEWPKVTLEVLDAIDSTE